MRALTYHVGVSLDGFIAAPDGSIDAFPVTEDVMEFIAEQYPETLPTHMREQLGMTACRSGSWATAPSAAAPPSPPTRPSSVPARLGPENWHLVERRFDD